MLLIQHPIAHVDRVYRSAVIQNILTSPYKKENIWAYLNNCQFLIPIFILYQTKKKRLPRIMSQQPTKNPLLVWSTMESDKKWMELLALTPLLSSGLYIYCSNAWSQWTVVYGTVHFKELLSYTIGHSSDFGLPCVAILPWLCRQRRKAIFTHSCVITLMCHYSP